MTTARPAPSLPHSSALISPHARNNSHPRHRYPPRRRLARGCRARPLQGGRAADAAVRLWKGRRAGRARHHLTRTRSSRWPGVIPTRTPLPSPRTTATSSCYSSASPMAPCWRKPIPNISAIPGSMPTVARNHAIWSPDSRMLIRQYDIRFGTDVYRLYRIGADGALSGEIDLDKMIEDAVYARLQKIGPQTRRLLDVPTPTTAARSATMARCASRSSPSSSRKIARWTTTS